MSKLEIRVGALEGDEAKESFRLLGEVTSALQKLHDHYYKCTAQPFPDVRIATCSGYVKVSGDGFDGE